MIFNSNLCFQIFTHLYLLCFMLNMSTSHYMLEVHSLLCHTHVDVVLHVVSKLQQRLTINISDFVHNVFP